jgi:hypothetical protein
MDHGYQAPAVVAGGLVLSVTRSTVGRRDVRLQALDAADGTVAWTLPLGKDGLGRWSPPTVANIEGRDTVVLLYNQMILGVDLVQGRRLWSFDAMAQADLPGQAGTIGHTPEDAHSPRISGRVVVAEYRHFQIKGALACDSTCLGVKIVDGQPELLWKRDEMVNWWDGQAVRNGRLYGIVRHPRGRFNATIAKYHYRHKQQRAALGCYDMHTGQCLWSSEHPWTSDQTDESFQAAELTLHGDRIVLHDEQRLVIGHIGQQGYTPLTAWRLRGPAAAPTVAGDRLYVRTVADGQLTCFNLPSRPESQE